MIKAYFQPFAFCWSFYMTNENNYLLQELDNNTSSYTVVDSCSLTILCNFILLRASIKATLLALPSFTHCIMYLYEMALHDSD